MLEIIPDKQRVVSIVEQARDGRLCLPDFQRDFVWKRDEVADLLRSILRRYYIGSLLLLQCDPHDPPFAPAFLRGAVPRYQKPQPQWLILDGQQRLTALLYALTAPQLGLKDSVQRRLFFVDLSLLIEDPESDAVVFDRAERELKGLDHIELQYEQRVLPCTRLINSQAFYTWRDGFDDWLRIQHPDQLNEFRAVWRDHWTTVVSDFQTFNMPLVVLPQVGDKDSVAIGRVCAIFEKLNSTGEPLSIYDLLTARLYRWKDTEMQHKSLHDLWDDSCKKLRRLREWSEGDSGKNKFGILVLRTLALLRGLDPKPRFLIELKPQSFVRDWQQAADAIEEALRLLTLVNEDGFGVFDRKWLPGIGMIPALAALRTVIREHRLDEAARADLRRWYWCNVFLERYSSAVETKLRRDYAEFSAYWTEGAPEPSVFGEARARIGAPGFTVRESSTPSSSIYSGIFCLLAIRGARDWRRSESIQLQELHDHHIFPQAYLRRGGITRSSEINSVLNRTLISDETNTKILDKSPADYILNPGILPADDKRKSELLLQHFINPAALSAMSKADGNLSAFDLTEIYREFLNQREAAIISCIRSACGINVADTTPADGR